jgi:hypothetical protein
MKIYLDNCCYNRPFDGQNQDLIRLETEAKLVIQNRIKQGLYSLVWSFMLNFENDGSPTVANREAIRSWQHIASEYCPASDDILSSAKEMMPLGLKHKDAIHLACAMKCQCDYLITTDRKFSNKNDLVAGIEIINPITFILKTEAVP